MSWPGLQRWSQLLANVGVRENAGAWYEKLMRAYAEPHRRYHNQQHIADCLAEFDTVPYLAEQPDAVELALWFHDAVYDPKAADKRNKVRQWRSSPWNRLDAKSSRKSWRP